MTTSSTSSDPDPLPLGDAGTNRRLMDAIAEAFDESREHPWEPVLEFLEGFVPGARILDLACGNGRHALPAAGRGLLPVAVDVSGALLRRLKQRAEAKGVLVECVEADAARSPFPDGTFQGGLFIAGVHCIRGRQARLEALRAFRRALRPGAFGLVSVWSRDQDRFREHFEQERELHPRRVALHEARGEPGEPPEFGDIDLPWSHGVVGRYPRFFHLYTMPEFVADLQAAGFRIGPQREVCLGRGPRPDNHFVVVKADDE